MGGAPGIIFLEYLLVYQCFYKSKIEESNIFACKAIKLMNNQFFYTKGMQLKAVIKE